MRLPKSLHPWRKELLAALETPLLAGWPMQTAYTTADQPAAIGKLLIELLHEELGAARIAFLFREQMKRGTQIRLGTATKAGGKLGFLANLDFTIEFNWEAWRTLSGEQRIALVDHELCHCTLDGDSGECAMRHHDVEEFGEIVRRWGLWQPDLLHFGRDVQRAIEQHDLFEQAEAVQPDSPSVRQQPDAALADAILPDGIEAMTIESGDRKLTLHRAGATS